MRIPEITNTTRVAWLLVALSLTTMIHPVTSNAGEHRIDSMFQLDQLEYSFNKKNRTHSDSMPWDGSVAITTGSGLTRRDPGLVMALMKTPMSRRYTADWSPRFGIFKPDFVTYIPEPTDQSVDLPSSAFKDWPLIGLTFKQPVSSATGVRCLDAWKSSTSFC